MRQAGKRNETFLNSRQLDAERDAKAEAPSDPGICEVAEATTPSRGVHRPGASQSRPARARPSRPCARSRNKPRRSRRDWSPCGQATRRRAAPAMRCTSRSHCARACCGSAFPWSATIRATPASPICFQRPCACNAPPTTSWACTRRTAPTTANGCAMAPGPAASFRCARTSMPARASRRARTAMRSCAWRAKACTRSRWGRSTPAPSSPDISASPSWARRSSGSSSGWATSTRASRSASRGWAPSKRRASPAA